MHIERMSRTTAWRLQKKRQQEAAAGLEQPPPAQRPYIYIMLGYINAPNASY